MAEGNQTIARLAMFWDALRALLTPGGPEASGWVSIETEQTKDGPVRVLHLKGRKDIAEGWKAPTLLLDALLPVELVRTFWPDVELVADVKAEMPHQHVQQVVDKAFALSMLGPLDEEAATADPEEAQRRTNRLHDLRATLISKPGTTRPAGCWSCCRSASRKRCPISAACRRTSSWRTTTTSPAGTSGATWQR